MQALGALRCVSQCPDIRPELGQHGAVQIALSMCVCVCVCVCNFGVHILCSDMATPTHSTFSQGLCALHRSDMDLMNMLMSILQNLLVGCYKNCELFKRSGGEVIMGQLIREMEDDGLGVLAAEVLYSLSTTW